MKQWMKWCAVCMALQTVAMAETKEVSAPTPDALAAARENYKGADYLNTALAADLRAKDALNRMTFEEKKTLVAGYKTFFIAPVERLGLRPVFLSDASAGIRIGKNLFGMDKSIAYPATVALAATWEPELAYRYGSAIGAECRAGGPDVLLGPGVNLFRSSECGRNYEYMGEDPLLAGTMAAEHIRGVQSQRIMATGKHFLLNNHEWQRHACDIRVDERTLRELYARAWYRMIHVGQVGAVMTSYNLVDGEKAGENHALVTDFLETELGFNGLVMSDWGGIWDKNKAIDSGLDLIMPNGKPWCEPGKEAALDAKITPMCEKILTACFTFGFYDRDGADPSFDANIPSCEKTALDVARRAITLLKNDQQTLPLDSSMTGRILVTGPSAEKTPFCGRGSGQVEGYDHTHILSELKKQLGDDRVYFVAAPTDAQLKEAAAAVVCVNSNDHENSDRPFALDAKQETLIRRVVRFQPRSVVVLNSGGAVRMKSWSGRAGAIVHAYFAGQYGGTAIAEVLTGKVNPSGKLPFTVEREFADSPAAHDRPDGVDRTDGGKGWIPKPLVRVDYNEGLFIGYRWYEKKNCSVQYPFGHGLSYTSFEYGKLSAVVDSKKVSVSLVVRNSGDRAGAETVQLYLSDLKSSVERPLKELCGFRKIDLFAGAAQSVLIEIPVQDLAFYDTAKKAWKVEAGDYRLMAGSSSADIRRQTGFRIEKDCWFDRPVQ